MVTPKISICIPAFNVEKYISRCLDSILCQTFQDFEIVVVDDASTDKSLSIVKEYQQTDNRIKIIEKKNNEGSMMARKTGYQTAKGAYIFFCDSDDYLPPNSLESLFIEAQTSKSDIVIGNFRREYGNGRYRDDDRASKALNLKEYKKAILCGTLCSIWGILFKTSLFHSYQYTTFYNQSFSEDRILLCQLLDHATSISSTDAITYIYFLNNESMTQKRLTIDKLQQQLFALTWCYQWNNRNKELEFLNKRWFLRYLSFYIESGCYVKTYLDSEIIKSKLLCFKSIQKYLGLKLAIHTYLCEYLRPYQIISSHSRKIIQKVLRALHNK